ncbi:nitroreductase family protein [Flavobacterium crassostreae]|uniref:Nitroreductase n=1 Tax=Flavobacterium crassostreae TaxID=1763534 RepID=A0A1B9DKI6_9FLAO|nr:nitroreductase family protein [Flavobacterium crassostreae]OCB70208.1 nitroreductase [Flavobacterium crassostreae]
MDLTNQKTVAQAIEYRRSVRVFKKDALEDAKVKECIRLATLAPSSSNMQLWEFYHISSPEILQNMAKACLNQNAAKTAQQMVVVVVRKDLWKKRAAANIAFLKSQFGNKPTEQYTKREQFALQYYQKLIPTLYLDFLGILGWIKFFIFQIIGVFKPVYRQTTKKDMDIVAQKSAGLAAQNFINSMAAIDYDTCPMEGFDSLRVKKILRLPASAAINMVLACGIKDQTGIYSERFRVPLEDVYFKI